MNKYLKLVVFILALISVEAKAQFTFHRIDPPLLSVTIGDSTQQIKSHAVVRNTTSSNITLNINIINTYVTPGWALIGMCDWHICYGPGTYSITSVIAPNVNDTLYVYFTPNAQPGNGHCTVSITYQSTTINQDFGVEADPIGIHQISTTVNEFSLNQNYPNPFNPNTKINFTIPKTEAVYLKVYDLLGREVKSLVSETLTQGEYQVDFDAKNLSSGMYYYSLRAGDFVAVKKMVLVK